MKTALVLQLALAGLALGGAPPGPETVANDAGYISVGPDGAHNLFYWYFESRNDPANDPLVIWLSGGPGCSSQLAMFSENGPYVVHDETLELELNAYAWNANATVIWVDQPVGTGFSYGGLLHDEDQVASDMYEFIVGWLGRYPQYAKLAFFLFGESYAGHYVPAISRYIVRQIAAGDSTVQFVGAGIGNGLTDPGVQYRYYKPFAEAHGLVSDATLGFMEGVEAICEPLIAGCNANSSVLGVDDPVTVRALSWSACLNAYLFCNLGEITPIQATGVNVYDVRVPCGDSQLCYDFSSVDAYLNQPDVQAALGVQKEWKQCATLVDLGMAYGGDWMKEFNTAVAETLDAGVRVLIYAGEYDFMCNWLGNQAWTDALAWSGAEQFAAAANQTWALASGEVAGSFKSAAGLTFLKVKDAGHLVPHDVPAASLEMVVRHFAGGF